MTVREKVSVWLTTQPGFVHGLSYSDRQRLKEGGHEDIVANQVRKRNKEIRLFKFSAGVIGVVLAVVGLISLFQGIGLVDLPSGPLLSSSGEGSLFILGAVAVAQFFRISEMGKWKTLFEQAVEIDSYFEKEDRAR